MPKTVRFHLDESVDPRVAVGLRRLGADVTTSQEVGLLHASDAEQMSYLLRERRAILTQDADFLRSAAAGVDHPGILFYEDQRRTIGDVIRGAQLVWELLEPIEMHGHVEYL
jgi:hypothetical protein